MISNLSTHPDHDARHRDTPSRWATQPLPVITHSEARPFIVTPVPPRATRHSRLAHTSVYVLPILVLLFAALNLGDVITTYIGLHSGMHEGNPLMSGLLAHFGFSALIVYKLLVVAAVSIGVYFLRAFNTKVASATIWICNALVLVVVLLNIMQFLMS